MNIRKKKFIIVGCCAECPYIDLDYIEGVYYCTLTGDGDAIYSRYSTIPDFCLLSDIPDYEDTLDNS